MLSASVNTSVKQPLKMWVVIVWERGSVIHYSRQQALVSLIADIISTAFDLPSSQDFPTSTSCKGGPEVLLTRPTIPRKEAITVVGQPLLEKLHNRRN